MVSPLQASKFFKRLYLSRKGRANGPISEAHVSQIMFYQNLGLDQNAVMRQ